MLSPRSSPWEECWAARSCLAKRPQESGTPAHHTQYRLAKHLLNNSIYRSRDPLNPDPIRIRSATLFFVTINVTKSFSTEKSMTASTGVVTELIFLKFQIRSTHSGSEPRTRPGGLKWMQQDFPLKFYLHTGTYEGDEEFEHFSQILSQLQSLLFLQGTSDPI